MPHFPPSDLPLTPRGSCTMRPGTSCARVLADSLNNALEGPRGHASSPTGCEDCLCEERKQPRETIAAPPMGTATRMSREEGESCRDQSLVPASICSRDPRGEKLSEKEHG